MKISTALIVVFSLSLAATAAVASLSIEDALGTFIFTQLKDGEYWCGFLEFDAAHGFVMVVHIDENMDQIEDRYLVVRGTYEVRARESGELGLYLMPQGGEPGFLRHMDFSGMHLSTFVWQGFDFRRRRGQEPLFDLSGNQPGLSGVVEIHTEPPGATVILDGRRLPGATPIILDSVTAGIEHMLRIEQVEFQPHIERFTLNEDEGRRIEIELITGSATFALKTEPVVKVWMDESYLGFTPLWHEGVPAGSHRIEIRNGALGIEQTFDIILEEGQVWKKIMRWLGSIQLACDTECMVYEDDKLLGSTPLDIELPIGVHRLDLFPLGAKKGRRVFVRIELDQATQLNVIYDELKKDAPEIKIPE